jgi:hypothetical protein
VPFASTLAFPGISVSVVSTAVRSYLMGARAGRVVPGRFPSEIGNQNENRKRPHADSQASPKYFLCDALKWLY